MSWSKRIRANLPWAMFGAVIIIEKYNWHKVALIFLLALLFAILYSLFDVAQVRWSTPLHWPRIRRRPSDGSA
jgi:hypothetical protein